MIYFNSNKRIYVFRVQKCTENGPLISKSWKKSDEKVNINIFLANNVPELDLGSDSESGVRKTNEKTVLFLKIRVNKH